MRFSRTIGTSAMFLSAVCWSFSDASMPYFPSVDAQFKASLLHSQLSGGVLSVKNTSSLSYPLNLQVFGIQVVVQVSMPSIEEQILEIDLTGLRQQKDLSLRASTHLEKLLSLLSEQHSTAQMHFTPASQKAKISSGKFVVETEVTIKDTERNDLPMLLEEDALRQLFLAVECAQSVNNLTEGEIYPCHSGSLVYMTNNQLMFELRPEYQSVPASLPTYQTDSSLQFSLNATTRVVLTLNSDGTIYKGDAYFSEIDMDSGTPRTVSKKKKGNRGSKSGSGHRGSSQKVVLFYVGAGPGCHGNNSPPGSAGAGGKPPEKPNQKLDKTPASAVIIDDDEDKEKSEEQEQQDNSNWGLNFQWPDDESGYSGSDDTLKNIGDREPVHSQNPRSQWGNGEIRSSDQRSRANKDYVNDGRRLKDSDQSNDETKL